MWLIPPFITRDRPIIGSSSPCSLLHKLSELFFLQDYLKQTVSYLDQTPSKVLPLGPWSETRSQNVNKAGLKLTEMHLSLLPECLSSRDKFFWPNSCSMLLSRDLHGEEALSQRLTVCLLTASAQGLALSVEGDCIYAQLSCAIVIHRFKNYQEVQVHTLTTSP